MALVDVNGVNTSTSGATTYTTDLRLANPYNAGSATFTQVVASTSEDWAGFYVINRQANHGVLSVWKGAVSSEVRVASMPTRIPFIASNGFAMYVPVPIASGTRLSVSVSSRTAGSGNQVQIVGLPSSNFAAEPSFTVMDFGPINLDGTSSTYAEWQTVDPGATANTEGSYTEISFTGTNSAANNLINGDQTDHQYEYLGLVLTDNQTFQADHNRLWTFATGAATAEIDFCAQLYEFIFNDEVGLIMAPFWIPWNRASGDRISAKMQASTNDSVDRIGKVIFFGVR